MLEDGRQAGLPESGAPGEMRVKDTSSGSSATSQVLEGEQTSNFCTALLFSLAACVELFPRCRGHSRQQVGVYLLQRSKSSRKKVRGFRGLSW